MLLFNVTCADDSSELNDGVVYDPDSFLDKPIPEIPPGEFIQPPLRRGQHIWYVTNELGYASAGRMVREGTYLQQRDGKTPETSFEMMHSFKYIGHNDTIYLEYANYGDEELQIYTQLPRWQYFHFPNTKYVKSNGQPFAENENPYQCNCSWQYSYKDSVYIMWYD